MRVMMMAMMVMMVVAVMGIMLIDDNGEDVRSDDIGGSDGDDSEDDNPRGPTHIF